MIFLLTICAFLMILVYLLLYLIDEKRVTEIERKTLLTTWMIFCVIYVFGCFIYFLSTIGPPGKRTPPNVKIENNTQTVPDNIQNINITPPNSM